MKTLQNVSNAELNAAAQVLQKTISEAAGKEITVAWDQDDPFAYAGDWSDEYDIYLSDWDEKKDVITVSGTEKDLMNWLTSEAGMDKKQAQSEIKSGKRIKV